MNKIFFLAPDVILKMIINDKKDYINKFKKMEGVEIVTSAIGFWEVMSCLSKEEIKKYSDRIHQIFKQIPIADLKDIWKQATCDNFEIENKERIKHLRKIALGG